jgi:hypothetical protein
MPATAWDLFCSAWFSVFSRWLTAKFSFTRRSCWLSGWSCSEASLCSARCISSALLSWASAFLSPAMSPALCCRGSRAEVERLTGGPLKPGFGLSGGVQISSILSSRQEQITARAVICGVEGPTIMTSPDVKAVKIKYETKTRASARTLSTSELPPSSQKQA